MRWTLALAGGRRASPEIRDIWLANENLRFSSTSQEGSAFLLADESRRLSSTSPELTEFRLADKNRWFLSTRGEDAGKTIAEAVRFQCLWELRGAVRGRGNGTVRDGTPNSSRPVVIDTEAGSYKPQPPDPPSMHTAEFVDRLDTELRTDDYADVDASPNGLQVGTRAGELEHVAFAVDAAEATIEAAVDAGADALVTHHGVVFGGLDRVTGREYERIAPLVEHDIDLYVSHLPLDGHLDLGNAAGVADLLSLDVQEPFGTIGTETVGLLGECANPLPLADLAATLESELDTGSQSVQTLPFGPEEAEHVAVLTGSGTDWLGEADAVGADTLVTGEGKQQVYHEAREAGINVVLAGHYATETFGVRALQELAEEWALETTYLDHPTGL